MNIVKLKTVKSTQDFVKKYIKNGADTLVVSQTQKNGRGTKGRAFLSAEGGIYLSHLKFYSALPAQNAFSIVQNYSVAVVRTLRAFGIDAKIKWPNDVLVQGKKICGILTENCLENGQIKYSVVGVGLNVTNQIDQSLCQIAISAKDVVPNVDFERVLATLIFNLEQPTTFDEYLRLSCVVGKTVRVQTANGDFVQTVTAILPDGRIELADGQKLSSAEIKIIL